MTRPIPMSSAPGTLRLASATDPTEQTRAPNAASPAGHNRPRLSEPVVPRKKHQATEQPGLQATLADCGGFDVAVKVFPETLDSLDRARLAAGAPR
jgi:hypothetical protein